jgi:hypothetical protein
VIVQHLKRQKNRKRKAEKTEAAEWRPDYLGDGLYDLIFAAVPQIDRATFDGALRKHLKEWNSSFRPQPDLIEVLYQKARYCLQQLEGIRRMREILQSKDWKRREVVIRKLQRSLRAIELCFNKFRDPKLSQTDALVRFVIARTKAFTQSLRRDIEFSAKLIANDVNVTSGFLKPQVESLFFLETDNYLKRNWHSLDVTQRLLIISGCAKVARILPPNGKQQAMQDLIYSRIHRARHSGLRASGN